MHARLSDAAKKRDPTQSNDLRRRIMSGFRHDLNEWRKQVYAAIVQADALGYDYGEVDPDDIEELIDRMDTLLRRQAEYNFISSSDRLDASLRTAYARGVRKAGEEVTPVLPFTTTSGDLLLQSKRELEGMLDDQIETALAKLREDELAAALSSRHKLYAALLLPVLILPLAKRLKSLANTSVTRSYNGGKIDAYEEQGVTHVGIDPKSQPYRRAPPRPELLELPPSCAPKSSHPSCARPSRPRCSRWRLSGMTRCARYAKDTQAWPTRWRKRGP